MRKPLPYCLFLFISISILSGCGNKEINRSLKSIEAMLDNCPVEALALLDEIDTTALRFKSQRMRHHLLYAIALDKNHIDDGRYVNEMVTVSEWHERFGSKINKLRARYYYGDQLRGAGRLEEAAVQFTQAEKEAVVQENWFLAGMSARSLFYVFAQTNNFPKELSCIERALQFYRKAGKLIHEDDARIKLAMAYYDNSQIEKADSVFNRAIKVAEEKKDTVRLYEALVSSTDVFLVKDYYQPDSVIVRLSRAENLGYRPNSRSLANYALAYSLKGDKALNESYLRDAYNLCRNEKEKAFVSLREHTIHCINGDTSKAYSALAYLNSYINNEATKILEQSVIEAYNSYLELSNDRLSLVNRTKQKSLFLTILLAIAVFIILYLVYKRVLERQRIEADRLRMEMEQQRLSEEESRLKADRYRLACEELESFGFEVFDRIGQVYYSAENNPVSVVKAYGSIIEKLRDEEYQKKVIASIDKTHDGVVTKLESQIPSISQSRLVFFAYLVQGLSYTTISVIMDANQRQNLYDIRKRLVQTIKKNAPADENLFLSYLENRTTD